MQHCVTTSITVDIPPRGVTRSLVVLLISRRRGPTGAASRHAVSFEPLRLTAGTPIEQPDATGAHTVIERYDSIGLRVDHVDEDFEARMPTADERNRLSMPSDTPVFAVVRTHWAGDVAVETASIVIRGDRMIVNFIHQVPPT